MRRFLCTAAVLLFPLTAMAGAQGGCDQAAFAAVVAEAGAALSAMNGENKKSFQDRLQLLRSRENWSDADYLAKATPFVKDGSIAAFDDGNKTLLAKVQALGAAPVAAGIAPLPSPDGRHCAMLDELRGLMAQVVENTRAKWGYMLGKVDAAMEASRQAKAAQ